MENSIDVAIGKTLACWMNYSLASIQNSVFDYFSNLEDNCWKNRISFLDCPYNLPQLQMRCSDKNSDH